MGKTDAILRQCLSQEIQVVVLGASAGGVEALKKTLIYFKRPSHLSVAVVLHIPAHGQSMLPAVFAPLCDFKAIEPYSQEKLRPEYIYFAPANYHLNIEPSATLSLSMEGKVNFSRPSIDLLFESAAYAFGKRCLAVLLTGANHDGAQGLKKVQEFGGITIVQDPDEAEFPMMPSAGKKAERRAHVLKLEDIAHLITGLNGEKSRG